MSIDDEVDDRVIMYAWLLAESRWWAERATEDEHYRIFDHGNYLVLPWVEEA